MWIFEICAKRRPQIYWPDNENNSFSTSILYKNNDEAQVLQPYNNGLFDSSDTGNTDQEVECMKRSAICMFEA